MKVHIGPYTTWVGPYQIAEFILFWMKDTEDGMTNETVHKFGKWLSEDKNGKPSWLTKLCQAIEHKKKRRIDVRIDHYDVWSMDSTLAYIALPMLKRLQEIKHGAPYTDDEDVPDELKSASAPAKEHEYDTDENHFKRWEYIIGEMIFAFDSKLNDWEEQFYNETFTPEVLEKRKQIQERISNGFRLFGKYYEGLWD